MCGARCGFYEDVTATRLLAGIGIGIGIGACLNPDAMHCILFILKILQILFKKRAQAAVIAPGIPNRRRVPCFFDAGAPGHEPDIAAGI